MRKPPTIAERERLALLIEECAEVIHAATKILRHGYSAYHPDGGPNNHYVLQQELGDLRFAIILMVEAHDVERDEIHAHAHSKGERVREYLHHQTSTMIDRAIEAAK